MPKTISLKGAAAQAFFMTQSGVAPKTEAEAYVAVATYVHAAIHGGNTTGAVKILEHLVQHGALKTAESLAGV